MTADGGGHKWGAHPSEDALTKSNEAHFIVLKHQTSQSSGRIGSGIDIDAVGANIRFQGWRVAVNNDFAKIILVQEKVLSDP